GCARRWRPAPTSPSPSCHASVFRPASPCTIGSARWRRPWSRPTGPSTTPRSRGAAATWWRPPRLLEHCGAKACAHGTVDWARGWDNRRMNPLLNKLQPYPFERLRGLTAGVTPNPAYRPISLGIGEPKHPTPVFIKEALSAALDGLANYPATAGEPALRQACADWAERRYGLKLDATAQILPVNGSREALFALAQAVIDPTQHRDAGGPAVVSPNPFYQIYEGAALLAGGRVVFANSDPARNFAADWSSIPESTWATTQLLFVCSPGNPTGAVMPLDEWQRLFELSDRHGFVIASDECYSEIYFREGAGAAPLGGLEAAAKLGRTDFRNLVMLTSLSKRSNV